MIVLVDDEPDRQRRNLAENFRVAEVRDTAMLGINVMFVERNCAVGGGIPMSFVLDIQSSRLRGLARWSWRTSFCRGCGRPFDRWRCHSHGKDIGCL
jgi:hypothetical protein